MANGWTPERKAKQSELIQNWKPWQHSTGARTPEGKSVSSRNAYKGGSLSLMKVIAAVLKDYKEGKLIEESITTKRDDFGKEIQAIDQKIEKEIADIRAKQRTASQEVLEAKQEMLVKLQRSRDNRVQEAEAEFKKYTHKLLAGFDGKLRKELMRWAEKNQFDCVSLKETGEVIYVSDKINYTPQLIDILNTEFEKENKIKAAKEATKN